MIVGVFVLVEVTAGISEASVTPQPTDTVHTQLAVDDARRVRAHHSGAPGVIARAVVAPRVIEQLVVGLDMGPGQALVPDELPQRGCGENPPPTDRIISRAASARSTRPLSENLTRR